MDRMGDGYISANHIFTQLNQWELELGNVVENGWKVQNFVYSVRLPHGLRVVIDVRDLPLLAQHFAGRRIKLLDLGEAIFNLYPNLEEFTLQAASKAIATIS